MKDILAMEIDDVQFMLYPLGVSFINSPRLTFTSVDINFPVNPKFNVRTSKQNIINDKNNDLLMSHDIYDKKIYLYVCSDKDNSINYCKRFGEEFKIDKSIYFEEKHAKFYDNLPVNKKKYNVVIHNIVLNISNYKNLPININNIFNKFKTNENIPLLYGYNNDVKIYCPTVTIDGIKKPQINLNELSVFFNKYNINDNMYLYAVIDKIKYVMIIYKNGDIKILSHNINISDKEYLSQINTLINMTINEYYKFDNITFDTKGVNIENMDCIIDIENIGLNMKNKDKNDSNSIKNNFKGGSPLALETAKTTYLKNKKLFEGLDKKLSIFNKNSEKISLLDEKQLNPVKE